MDHRISGFGIWLRQGLVGMLIAWAAAAPAHADIVNPSYLQGLEPIATEQVTAYGTELFGDQLNLFNGSLAFEHTDLSLPGNSGLPVALTRRHQVGRSLRVVGQMGDWDLELPRIGGTFTSVQGWVTRTGGTSRCSSYSLPPFYSIGSPPPGTTGPVTTGPVRSTGEPPPSGGDTDAVVQGVAWEASEFHGGVMLQVPGAGAQEVLQRSPAYGAAPLDGALYPLVTHGNWQIGCLPSIQNAPGEGFVAVSPAGVRYRFDWMASRRQVMQKKGGFILQLRDHFLMATEVSDRFGNWVRYRYDPANPYSLVRIDSSDGRVISIVNSGGRAVSASDGTRTFTYAYGSRGELTAVTRPDGSRWLFNLLPMVPPDMPNLGQGATCDQPGEFPGEVLAGSITHPSGATGSFTTEFRLFGRTYVDRHCWFAPGSTTVTTGAVFPKIVATQALVSKRISGPGMVPLNWGFVWFTPQGWAPCNGCSDKRVLTVTEPTGLQTRHTFGNRWRVNEGQLLSVEQGVSGTTVLQKVEHRYRLPAGQAYPEQFGTSLLPKNDWLATRHRPLDRRVVTLQGQAFTWEVDPTAAGFDALVRPLKVTRTGSQTRTDLTQYHDHLGHWVLGQTARVIEVGTGIEIERHAYDPASGLRSASWSYGLLTHSLGYHADGSLARVIDAANRVTQLSGYWRGQPQTLIHPDGAVERQSINNLGQPDSRTNALGHVTTYAYDAMGRIRTVVPPTGHATSVRFEPVGFAQYGLSAGHWQQTVTKGQAQTLRLFDALWRERLDIRQDLANPEGTRSAEETRYGLDGRVSFGSYPQRNIVGVDGALPGTATVHDALGRVVQQRADSELGVLVTSTQYPATSYSRRVTNPRGYTTTSSFQTFDQPQEDAPVSISAPEGVTLSITRDRFGKPVAITRGGITRRYVYDVHQRLCKTIEPESGSTVQAYDLAGNVAWRASGLSLGLTGDCQQGAVPASARISFGYDARNRVTSQTHGDGSPGVTRSYWPDGLPRTIGTPTSVWTLAYDSRRLLESETLSSVLGSFTYSYGRDAYGHVASMSHPGGPTVTYGPDALGRPTRVSGFVSSVTHHPDGQLAGYVAGNGIAYSLTQNLRGLPARSRHAGVVQDRMSYDAAGNVTAIVDEQQGVASRSMAYDGLDRLTAANGIWGAGRFAYDVHDNLTASTVGARALTHLYDASNRLVGVSGSFNASVAYDARGNVVNRAGQGYGFDIANRMTMASGVASYLYDGHGRRAWTAHANGHTTLRVYGQGGRLLLTQDSQRGTTHHIHLAGRVVAEVNSVTGMRWLHTDLLGSPVAATGPTGAVLERTHYEPYGLTAAGTNPANLGFTGHVNDVETGLVYMQQRYYDPIAGRFLSVDPVVADSRNGGHFNRYEYAESNPLRFIDPDGRESCTGSNFACRVGGLATGFSGAVSNFTRAVDTTITGGYGQRVSQAFGSGEYASGVGWVFAGAAFGVANVLTLGEGGVVASLAAKGVRAGEAGAFSSLKGVKGDGLTAHHMPQAAAGRTGYNEGGALVMTQAEHVATRTYGSKGIGTLQSDAGLSFRDVLARDIRDVRSIVGSKYNEGLRDLTDYYGRNFPDLIGK